MKWKRENHQSRVEAKNNRSVSCEKTENASTAAGAAAPAAAATGAAL